MITIKVLGSSCEECASLGQTAYQAIADLGIQAEVIEVSDYAEMLQYSVLSTPGLAINEQIVCQGRIPSKAEVTSWIKNALDKGV